MLKPICVDCRRFFKPKKTGYYFTEGMPITNGVRPGIADAALWKPYKVWSGDIYECDGCHKTIIVGIGLKPVSQQHHEDFHAVREKLDARFQVNDC